MLSGKLTSTLQALTHEEWKELQLFMESPYHNRGKEAAPTLALFCFFQAHADDFAHPNFTKEAAYAAAFPNTPTISGKLEKLMGRLYGLACRFIALQQEHTPDWLALATFYQGRNLPNLARQQHKAGMEALQNSTTLDAQHYWLQFNLNKTMAAYNGQYDPKASGHYLSQALQSLDLYYLLEKLDYACSLYSQGFHNNLQADIEHSASLHLLEGMLRLMADGQQLQAPAIAAYHAAHELLRNYEAANQTYSKKLENALNEHGQRLSAESNKSLHTILRIHAVGRYNLGNQAYLPVAFRLYQQHLANGWLYYDGKILPETMMNIVSLGLRNDEAAWVLDFLQAHRHRTAGNYPAEEAYQFNMAHYYFHCREFEKAGQLLNQDFQHFYQKMGARRLELMVLYEEQSVLLSSKMEAFKMLIFRLSKTHLTEKLRQLNNNFIDFLRQITHPATLGNSSRIEKLKAKLAQKERVAERDWLLRKLEGMR